jgi:esterase/lipase
MTSRAVVLLHGVGAAAPHESVALELALRQHGFHVSVPFLEGLRDRTQPWFWRWISESLMEVDRQVVAHREINLCGIKHGAALALAVAAERLTKLDSLVLISPRLSLGEASMSRLHVPIPWWLAEWRTRFRRQSRERQERPSDLPAHTSEEPPLPRANLAISSTQLREARRLTRHAEGALGRVHTPTLIIQMCEDAAAVTDLRYIQVHIGSQFVEVFLQSGNRLIEHGNASERTVLKVVEFFNDVARRRALAASSAHDA